MAIPDDIQRLRADEREAAMILTLFRLREQARLYARLYHEAHPDAPETECYRSAIAAAQHSAEPEHAFWGILSTRIIKIVTQALRREWTR